MQGTRFAQFRCPTLRSRRRVKGTRNAAPTAVSLEIDLERLQQFKLIGWDLLLAVGAEKLLAVRSSLELRFLVAGMMCRMTDQSSQTSFFWPTYRLLQFDSFILATGGTWQVAMERNP